ncbi:uncharacterized protein N0V89_002384 [Didymosphaeria variabile]|uniref:Uncharacterized protein n=1 Tax=Didymosphaeria variabile TaxID=1932322 RepID=A0A9W8XTE2_9PLEO|nr:uncharacterized protein N0V89_002384 [Didymosphaeria variabile]KAJ4357808.1 hypothetical protein N0V89_002384 [Didymosphaeria variabile]
MSNMRIWAFLLAVLPSCCLVSTLSFSHDFNGTVPSIPGITNFSYPTASSHIESGFADGLVNTAIHQPWPFLRGLKYSTRTIRYCYADQASQDAIECKVNAAMNLWFEVLGGKPGPDTGFNFYFSRAFAQGNVQFCYAKDSYNSKTAQGQWNAALHDKQDALVVSYRPVDENGNKPATSASLGYTPDNAMFPWQSRQARHYMQIADKDDVPRIAHELGHDTVIEYRPQNIAGYADALAAAIKDGVPEAEARNKLRDDVAFCQKYNFRGSAYVKGSDQPGIIQGDPTQGPLDFDFDSIMIYPSDAETDTAACRNDIAKCPMVRRVGQDQNGNAKFEYFPAKYKPSAKDAEFIRKHYPWEQTEN